MQRPDLVAENMDPKIETSQVINGRTVTHRQLETLKAVSETGSMTSAAKSLGISVPVVHKYVRLIEEVVESPVTASTPMGTTLTREGQELLKTFEQCQIRCRRDDEFTICCSPVTEEMVMSVLSSLKMNDTRLVVSDDIYNLRMMEAGMADMAIIDDPMYLFDVEGFETYEIGYMGMVFIDNGNSFIRYKYGAQRVAFMFLDTMSRMYTVDSETYSLSELLGSNKSYFVDEFLLLRKGLRMKSAIDPKVLRHAVTAVYPEETKKISRILRALESKDIR